MRGRARVKGLGGRPHILNCHDGCVEMLLIYALVLFVINLDGFRCCDFEAPIVILCNKPDHVQLLISNHTMPSNPGGIFKPTCLLLAHFIRIDVVKETPQLNPTLLHKSSTSTGAVLLSSSRFLFVVVFVNCRFPIVHQLLMGRQLRYLHQEHVSRYL